MAFSLEFEDKNRNMFLIGIYETHAGAWTGMCKDLDGKAIKPYYYRTWKNDNVETVDFGSHSEFYYITEI